MPGTITRVTRALPIAVASLAFAACSNASHASSTPTPTPTPTRTVVAGDAAYIASCKAEDAAYQKARPILNNSASAHKAYASLKTYTDQIEAAETDGILGSDVDKDLMVEYLDVGLLSVDQDESASDTQTDLDNFESDHADLVDDCKAHGYVSAATQ